MRLALYRHRVLRVRHAARPVVSIGNIAAGGTGKTPFVRWLAGELLARGLHPAILTRGYRRSGRGLLVVSDGAGHLAPAPAAGDEPALLARALPTVPVIADARRLRGARCAEVVAPHVAVHILDDGFAHVSLARDVDIVLLDATAPDGGGSLLPAGRLREPLASMARADLIVVTKAEQADPGAALELARRFAPGAPVYRARTEVLGIFDGQGEPIEGSDIVPKTAVAVAGLARPEAFWATVASLGIEPTARLPFPDHASYGDFAVGRIARVAEETGATAILTTEKDAVKLEGRSPLPVFRIAVRMRVVEPGFVPEVIARLGRRPS